MDVGDYFFVRTTLPTRAESIRQCARSFARKRGNEHKRFTVRLTPMADGQPPSATIVVRIS